MGGKRGKEVGWKVFTLEWQEYELESRMVAGPKRQGAVRTPGRIRAAGSRPAQASGRGFRDGGGEMAVLTRGAGKPGRGDMGNAAEPVIGRANK